MSIQRMRGAPAAAAVHDAAFAAYGAKPASRVEVLDRLALCLRAAAERVLLPTARAAAAFRRAEGWRAFGAARLADHARERFGRSGRWVCGMAALQDAILRLPALADALVGADGAEPLGAVKAHLVARVADAASLADWIARARALSVRALREAVRAALAAAGGLAGVRPEDTDDEERALVTLVVPACVRAAFDEIVELYRAVVGREATLADAVEALLAEAGPCEGDVAPSGADAWSRLLPPPRPESERVACSRAARRWASLQSPRRPSVDDVVERAGITLARFLRLEERAGSGGPVELDAQLRQLVAIEDELLRRLGEVVAEIGAGGGWIALPFAGVGRYAEERLGLPGTTLEDRVRVSRALVHHPCLRDAYNDGRLAFEATLLVLRAMGAGPVGDDVERAWVGHAQECTIKRLRDEVLAARRRALDPERRATPPRPSTDTEWVEGRRREPGLARRRVLAAGLLALDGSSPDVFLRLRLPGSLAADFLRRIEAQRRALSQLVAGGPPEPAWPMEQSIPSVRAARTFSARALRVPAWVALLSLLEDAVADWDDARGIPRRAADAIYRRDGYRCTAPGCTSRAWGEDHHIEFRSGGGGDEPENRTLLCIVHHKRLHQENTLAVEGTAPLGLTWTMGRDGIGGRFTCERRL